MRPIHRRSVLQAAAALGLAPALHAQDAYPTRPIKLVNPYAAGGPADTLARGLARLLEQRLKQPIVVDNKAGGAATIGTGFVARSRADGYTLLIGTSAGHVVTPLMQKVPYDGLGDFAFIGGVGNQPSVLVVHPSVGVSTVQELIALAKKEPGKLNYASAGSGGGTHLAAESFLQRAGIQISHVPYGGAAPAIKDVLGGQVQMGMLNLAATQAFIADGRLKPLAYGGAQRSPLLPQVPTMAEAGFKGSQVSTWYTLAAPKRTPVDVIETLRKAMADTQADPAYQTLLSSLGAERLDLSPAQTTAFVQADKVAMTHLLGKLNLLDK
ncbi:Bug family tripartite tricarboxylate transporter substrate binding protein [Pseudorhodoferax soli]|uniref:Tripartite-type tricarboxylate transporter receptor subunit TctC n=1 Tax=Pseudorhodoferax soli TaxID=545864 RepID=A0A368XSU1_9BURK|nr:tripartite tricarboxylate transporter substrate binding protein [Pseudorhodoferax soli]RCW70549.1 tripartite-type tricarboxylate transporter receptor subunit TctC [Pseudorhodoferax soli]